MLPGMLSNRALGEKVVEELSLPGRGRIVGEKKMGSVLLHLYEGRTSVQSTFFFFF